MAYDKEALRERLALSRALLDQPGWTLFQQEWQEQLEANKAALVYTAKGDDISFLRGVNRVLETLVNMAQVLDSAEANLLEDEPE